MNTHALISGEVIEYPTQPTPIEAFLSRVRAAVNDPAVSPAGLLALAYGVENPLLDTTTIPGRALVTKAVFENPVYMVFADLVARKQMLADGQTPEQVNAAYTVSVKEASARLKLSEQAIRTAITTEKLSAVKRNGEWYIRPESVDSYKVSNRGRKKSAKLTGGGVPLARANPTRGASGRRTPRPGGSRPG
jgi:hypothetical protein